MAKKEPTKVPITERALIQRINRKLKEDDRIMKAARAGTRAEQEVGRYYLINSRNHVVDGHCDLEEYGRDLGVLAPYEKLVSE